MGIVSKLIGGRKFLLGLLVIGIGIAIDVTFGLGSNLLTLLIFVAGGFFLGNVGEHVCDTLKEGSRSKAAATGAVSINNVAQVVNQIETRLNEIATAETAVQGKVEKLAQVTQSNVEAVNAILNVMKASR